MNKQEQVTDFLNRFVTGLPRCYGPYRSSVAWHSFGGYNRPAAEDVATELLGIAEFRALQLGSWLGTIDGEVITQAVEAVVPMFYAEDVALLVAALKLAAATQQQEGRQKAVAGAVVTLAVAGFGFFGTRGRAA